METANLVHVDLSFPKIVFVHGHSINFGRKESFFTTQTIKKRGKVLFNSRWRKIHSNTCSNWIVISGLVYPVSEKEI